MPVYDTNSPSDPAPPGVVPADVKIVVAGGFGVGKTTMVGAVSEMPPLTTEERLTSASTPTDDLAGVEAKSHTTVAMDFGRITLHRPRPMVLYLFGTPGQERFLFTWDDLAHGTLGAVILADTRRLEASFTAVGYFERIGVPFVVAVNEFDTAAYRYTPEEVRHALEIPRKVPVVLCDARDTHSAVTVLLILLEYALASARSRPTNTTVLGARP